MLSMLKPKTKTWPWKEPAEPKKKIASDEKVAKSQLAEHKDRPRKTTATPREEAGASESQAESSRSSERVTDETSHRRRASS